MDATLSIGVHALVYLNHKGESVSSEILAENICTNPARVRKVMSKLKKAGIIETKEGIAGGYRFARDAKSISLEKIASALEVRFVDLAWRSGDMDMNCLIASGMADIMDEIYQKLNNECYQKLKEITIEDIDNKIFQNKEEKHEQL